MAEETVVAESSAAAVEAPTFTNFDGWDDEGNPVVTKKAEAPQPEKADSAAADTSKETKTEDAADSAANKKQGKDRSAEARIKELAAEKKRLERELEEARKPKETQADSSTATKPERKPQQPAQPQPTRPKPTLADKGADGKPKYASYEEYNEDLFGWKAEQIFAEKQRDEAAKQNLEKVKKETDEASARYPDYWEKANPLITALNGPDIPRVVFDTLGTSPVLADLLYAIAGSAETSADFLNACRTNPGKALRVALLMEQEIAKELGKGKGGEKTAGESGNAQNGKGESGAEAAPAPKPRAPKPPTEVGGRGAPGEDALVTAAKNNDFRAFEAEQRRRALASRK